MKNEELDSEAALYVISIAAQLSGMHPQTLRQYDRLGLVSPSRTQGRGRRYSLRDIALLRNIQSWTHEGINLAGIKKILELESAMANMALEVAKLRLEVDALLSATGIPSQRALIKRPKKEITRSNNFQIGPNS
jgi:MerR family transcriptional regulator, heat shock protein HspR